MNYRTLVVAVAIMYIINGNNALICYKCTQDEDPSCGHTLGDMSSIPQATCSGSCMMSKTTMPIEDTIMEMYTRSCEQFCLDTCMNMTGITVCSQCCTTDLCNGNYVDTTQTTDLQPEGDAQLDGSAQTDVVAEPEAVDNVLMCYNCTQADDPECGQTLTDTSSISQVPCTGVCMLSKATMPIGGTTLEMYIRSCEQFCLDTCMNMTSITVCSQCCTTDLCNGNYDETAQTSDVLPEDELQPEGSAQTDVFEKPEAGDNVLMCYNCSQVEDPTCGQTLSDTSNIPQVPCTGMCMLSKATVPIQGIILEMYFRSCEQSCLDTCMDFSFVSDMTVCSECCTTDLCNSNYVDTTPEGDVQPEADVQPDGSAQPEDVAELEAGDNVLMCYNCSQVEDPTCGQTLSDTSNIPQVPCTGMCMLSKATVPIQDTILEMYFRSCEQSCLDTCMDFSFVSDMTVCSECCTTDLCNGNYVDTTPEGDVQPEADVGLQPDGSAHPDVVAEPEAVDHVLMCYNCTQADDPECGQTLTDTSSISQVPCTGVCMLSKATMPIGGTILEMYIRSCEQFCLDTCINMTSITVCSQCCTTDLCNGNYDETAQTSDVLPEGELQPEGSAQTDVFEKPEAVDNVLMCYNCSQVEDPTCGQTLSDTSNIPQVPCTGMCMLSKATVPIQGTILEMYSRSCEQFCVDTCMDFSFVSDMTVCSECCTTDLCNGNYVDTTPEGDVQPEADVQPDGSAHLDVVAEPEAVDNVLMCYNCTQADDPECGQTLTDTSSISQVPCTGVCMLSKATMPIGGTILEMYIRSCEQFCLDTCMNMTSITVCSQCCTTDLCNGNYDETAQTSDVLPEGELQPGGSAQTDVFEKPEAVDNVLMCYNCSQVEDPTCGQTLSDTSNIPQVPCTGMCMLSKATIPIQGTILEMYSRSCEQFCVDTCMDFSFVSDTTVCSECCTTDLCNSNYVDTTPGGDVQPEDDVQPDGSAQPEDVAELEAGDNVLMCYNCSQVEDPTCGQTLSDTSNIPQVPCTGTCMLSKATAPIQDTILEMYFRSCEQSCLDTCMDFSFVSDMTVCSECCTTDLCNGNYVDTTPEGDVQPEADVQPDGSAHPDVVAEPEAGDNVLMCYNCSQVEDPTCGQTLSDTSNIPQVPCAGMCMLSKATMAIGARNLEMYFRSCEQFCVDTCIDISDMTVCSECCATDLCNGNYLDTTQTTDLQPEGDVQPDGGTQIDFGEEAEVF
ncbi:uncharacterized protein LOC117115570 isoform X2 [Anneissia japonica]|uniref:uncharacterized protein LOC117115570 isoform X2 n=1 Tax=Anneissia japonica TaxID=1529436 RepID=UPI00142553A0|nr:uncharacterized protein LOC117115570 isoform X2 [Anneissia japonica]